MGLSHFLAVRGADAIPAPFIEALDLRYVGIQVDMQIGFPKL